MMLSLLLLLLLGSNCKATHFFGTAMTYYPKNTAGSLKVVLRSKMNFHLCTDSTTWSCLNPTCDPRILLRNTVIDKESGGEWCQREEIWSQQVLSNAPFLLVLNGGNWVGNSKNGITNWQAVTVVELRNRSDTKKANASPQTTILPLLRVPSNCHRDFNLFAFDPDGDDVRCRYGDASLECNPCRPPSVLSLSSSCTLSFSPTNSSNEGVYVVQMVMEDFPQQNITLTQTDGSQEVKTNKDAISKIPVQFVVSVDPAVPSCTDGLYLPKFLTPTPANGAHLYTLVNQPLEISIKAEALNSTMSELLYSGPSNINQNTSAPGQYILRWTPSPSEHGESHTICFVVQAISGSTVKYHSELRCVVVTVGNVTMTPSPPPVTTPVANATAPPTSTISYSIISSTNVVVGLRIKISASLPVSDDDIRVNIVQQIKDGLVQRGIPSNATLRLVSSVKTTASPGG